MNRRVGKLYEEGKKEKGEMEEVLEGMGWVEWEVEREKGKGWCMDDEVGVMEKW